MARKPIDINKPLTPKQEAFARAFVETNVASEAYRRAYDCSKMKDTSIHVNACKALADARVKLRVAALREGAAKRNDVTVDKIIRELALLGFSNMLDFIGTQDDGSAFVDLSKLTRDQAAAISEVTSEVYMDGAGEDAKPVKRTKFKLTDKRAALVDLGKHLGMFIERKEIGGPGAFDQMSVPELEEFIASETRELIESKPIKASKGATRH